MFLKQRQDLKVRFHLPSFQMRFRIKSHVYFLPIDLGYIKIATVPKGFLYVIRRGHFHGPCFAESLPNPYLWKTKGFRFYHDESYAMYNESQTQTVVLKSRPVLDLQNDL